MEYRHADGTVCGHLPAPAPYLKLNCPGVAWRVVRRDEDDEREAAAARWVHRYIANRYGRDMFGSQYAAGGNISHGAYGIPQDSVPAMLLPGEVTLRPGDYVAAMKANEAKILALYGMPGDLPPGA